MAKISNHEEVLQEAEYNENQVVTNVRQGYYKSKDGIDHLWVILECIDELIYANAEKLGIDRYALSQSKLGILIPETGSHLQKKLLMLAPPLSYLSSKMTSLKV